jgi:23S rRNA (guanine745-N1)-methyltransferase
MHIVAASNLACPVDGAELSSDGAALRCAHGHCFDRAREGYWNLLLVQHKASREPGDTKEMVAARRRFLEAGHFAPLADRVVEEITAIAAALPGTAELAIADAGCGEGYYLAHVCRMMAGAPSPRTLRLAGFDVSKFAVQAAARRRLPVAWLVAGNRHPPLTAASVDILLCMFGYPVWPGLARVQKPGGCIVLVDPGPDHLIELRRIIYPEVVRQGPPSLQRAIENGYRLERESMLRFPLSLETESAIGDLVAMTPHTYRIAAPGREALCRIERLDVTCEVCVRVLVLGSCGVAP